MDIQDIAGCTRVIGAGQGYRGLPLRDVKIDCPVNGPGTKAMLSAWKPTPDELAQLNAGSAVILTVLGDAHPPVMLSVSQVPCCETPVDRYLKERTERGTKHDRVSAVELYADFMEWQRGAGDVGLTLRVFTLGVQARGYVQVRSSVTWWHGLKLKAKA